MITSIDASECLIIFDFSNLSYATHYASVSSGINILYLTLNKILSFAKPTINSHNGTAIIFALDNFPKHKKLLVPSYKENRSKLEIDPRPMLREALMNTGVYFAESPDQEADDVIASLCKQYAQKKIRIISGDHDLLQLLGNDNIIMYRTTTGDMFMRADLEKKYGLEDWEKIPLYKACFGDPSDSIKPGLPRVRKKDILPVINSCSPMFDDFLTSLDASAQSEKTKEILLSNREVIRNNYSIVALNHDLVIDITMGLNDRTKFQQVLDSHRIKNITLFEYRYLLQQAVNTKV